jgi:hypothetical protein
MARPMFKEHDWAVHCKLADEMVIAVEGDSEAILVFLVKKPNLAVTSPCRLM